MPVRSKGECGTVVLFFSPPFYLRFLKTQSPHIHPLFPPHPTTHNAQFEHLLRPLQLGSIRLANRVVGVLLALF